MTTCLELPKVEKNLSKTAPMQKRAVSQIVSTNVSKNSVSCGLVAQVQTALEVFFRNIHNLVTITSLFSPFLPGQNSTNLFIDLVKLNL